MTAKPFYNVEDKRRVRELALAGFCCTEISERLGLSMSTVSRWTAGFDKPLKERKPRGPRKTNIKTSRGDSNSHTGVLGGQLPRGSEIIGAADPGRAEKICGI